MAALTPEPAGLDEATAAIESGLSSLTPTSAQAIIDRWHSACSQANADVDLGAVASGLASLRDLLAADALDGPAIGSVLRALADDTAAVSAGLGEARWTPTLDRLAASLGRAATAIGA